MTAPGIKYADLKLGEEVFHFLDWKTEERIVVAATRLWEWLERTKEIPITCIELRPEHLKHLMEHHGVEIDRILKMPLAATARPVMLLYQKDGSHVCCDGNHRLIRRGSVGLIDAPAYIVPRRVWRRFLIHDAPDVTRDQHEAWVYGGSRFEGPEDYPKERQNGE